MNAEFHYYAIYALSLRAGFTPSEARTLALSSQYVDNAIHAYEIVEEGGRYETLVTQNYLFWDEGTLRDIYLPFHFLPGRPELAAAERLDGEASPWTVTPDSPLAKELLIRALRSRNLHRVGIALHSYADTWAHQNFSGRLERANAIDPSSPLPPAGHLQALRSPDEATGLWTDPRLKPERARVDNRERFLAAAKKIYRYLRTFLGKGFEEEELVLGELAELWKRDGRDMAARLADFSIRYDLEPYERASWLAEAGVSDKSAEEGRSSGYDKLLWLKAELARRAGQGSPLRRVGTRGGFFGSNLWRWNEAARAHRAEALGLIEAAGLLPPPEATR